MTRVAIAIRELHRSENDLACALYALADRHQADHDLYFVGRDLAAWSEHHVSDLATAARDYNLQLDSSLTPNRVFDALERGDDLFAQDGNPELLILSDLRRLHRMTAGVALDWEILAQTAQALRQRELLDLTKRCRSETQRQLRWSKASLKENAAQIMISA